MTTYDAPVALTSLPSLSFLGAPAAQARAEVLVLAARAPQGAESGPRLLADGPGLEGLDLPALEAVAATLGLTGALDEVVRVPAAALPGTPVAADVLLVVGTGEELARGADPTRDSQALGVSRAAVLERAAARAARALAGTGSACFSMSPADEVEALHVAQGALTGAYAWAGRVPAPPAPLGRVLVLLPEGVPAPRPATALALAEGVALTRDLVNEPPNRLTPAVFADLARDVAASAGLEVEVLDERALAEQGFGGILGVGKGSVHPPRLVRLVWAPEGARRSVAMVGKGITFDSGGLSLKPAASMPEMKSDMAGAATVLGTLLAAARLGLGVRVEAWLALAENLPAADAQRPSDIVTVYGGTTVEITNTDAEGRLVMADALARAVREEPDALLDVATLTGAQIVALGEHVSGVMGTPALRDAVVSAAVAAGEAFWPMPLPEHLRSRLDSPYAALRNAVTGSRGGGMLTAGLFLREFTGSVPWAHLDVAGPAFNDGEPWAGVPTGGTGAGVATLLELLRGYED
ncbi:leucyl aminopeptidase [Actinomyces sp. W5033]|uniref:leucyl aminopeptidase n=1 Tax=Actinomyces sp. W5033 TaxID=3446479 RepID=UPI003EE3283F